MIKYVLTFIIKHKSLVLKLLQIIGSIVKIPSLLFMVFLQRHIVSTGHPLQHLSLFRLSLYRACPDSRICLEQKFIFSLRIFASQGLNASPLFIWIPSSPFVIWHFPLFSPTRPSFFLFIRHLRLRFTPTHLPSSFTPLFPGVLSGSHKLIVAFFQVTFFPS